MKFIDQELNARFETDGYCMFPLLNEAQIKSLRAFAEAEILTKEIHNTDYGMYVSLEESLELKTRAKEYVQQTVVPSLSQHIEDYQIHLGGYLIKAPDHSKYTFPHQDWTFVDDDSEDVSATVWISLYDLEEKNGTLGFLKGSHQFLDFPVGSPSPAVPTPLMGKEGEVFPYLKFEPVKAGDALVFNNKTIHAAQPNRGDFFRVAVGVGITPANSTLYHYYLIPENDS
ncbi:MAG: phytanoyl-CoA dioxygenase family protein, partial [Cyclobacteriaceae bacterium]